MKNFSKILFGATALCFFTFFAACVKDQNVAVEKAVYKNAAADAAQLAKLFDREGAKTETFTLDAEQGGVILTAQGTTFKVPANAFLNNQHVVSGEVTIAIKEIHKPSDMIFGNKPTVTNKGQLLASFGEFSITASQQGQALQLDANKGILASRPFKSVNGIAKNQVQNWIGDATSVQKGCEWSLMADNSLLAFQRENETLTMLIQSLAWCNWDRLMTDDAPNGRTTVSVLYERNFNENVETNNSRNDVTLSGVFFKPEGSNSVYKLYERMERENGLRVSQSYGNIVPIGMTGTLLAYSIIDGVYYVEVREVTISNGRDGGCQLSVNPQAASEEEFAEAVNAMNR